jgi:hypothetical protein
MVDRRTATTLMRFHPDELGRITARARRCGQPPARCIGETALGASPTPRHDAAAEPPLCALDCIGWSLDQLARFADAEQDAVLTARTSAAREGQRALVRHVAQSQRRSGGGTAR